MIVMMSCLRVNAVRDTLVIVTQHRENAHRPVIAVKGLHQEKREMMERSLQRVVLIMASRKSQVIILLLFHHLVCLTPVRFNSCNI